MDDDTKTEPECLIEFGDGVTVIVAWRRAGDAVVLLFPPIVRPKERRWRPEPGALFRERTASGDQSKHSEPGQRPLKQARCGAA